jgi:hypothetical protein
MMLRLNRYAIRHPSSGCSQLRSMRNPTPVRVSLSFAEAGRTDVDDSSHRAVALGGQQDVTMRRFCTVVNGTLVGSRSPSTLTTNT